MQLELELCLLEHNVAFEIPEIFLFHLLFGKSGYKNVYGAIIIKD